MQRTEAAGKGFRCPRPPPAGPTETSERPGAALRPLCGFAAKAGPSQARPERGVMSDQWKEPNMTLSLHPAVAAAAIASALFLAPVPLAAVASAQTAEQPAPPPPSVADPSDEQLRSFAAATLEVDRLNNQWASRIDQAADLDRRQELRTEALREMAEAVRDEGLSVEEYNALVNVVEADPAVADKVSDFRSEMAR